MLVPLQAAPIHELGGKALALRRLADRGLPVPEAWILPFGAFAEVLSLHGLRGNEADFGKRIREVRLPFSLTAPAPLCAVRSSAEGEDGGSRSFAGQYASVLGVVPSEFEAAVRTVWASAAGAAAYRGQEGCARMAVLVQPLVDARVSGVMFTINPVSGSWREMAVEAVWGLGDELVGGQVVPDRYGLRRPRRTPSPVQRALARVRLEKTHEEIAPQSSERVVGRTGIECRDVDAPFARKLMEEELLALGRLGLKAESALGGPQDVEWALDRGGRFVVLQSRPITAAPRLPRGGATLWTRRFLGERFPRGVSPLGWSIVGPLLESFVAYPATTARFLGGDAPFRVVQGHPYLNATVFRHLAFKWPGFPPPRFMLEFFPPDEAEAWVRRAAAPPDLRVYASILTTTLVEQRWKRFRWNPFTNHLAWRDYANSLDGRLAALEQAPPAAAIEVVVPILRDYVKVHITSLLFANLWWQWTEGHLDDEQARVLLQPGAGSITARINAELRALDRASLPAFLQRHGHRSDASWELWSTRWHEVPETVLAMAEMARSAPPPPPQADVEARIRGLGPVLSRAVRLTRAYLVLREEQRWHLDRIFDRLKARLLLLGRELFPDEPEAIRFLRVEELSLPPPMRSVVLGRRRDEQPMSNPPDFLRGDEAIPLPSRASARIQGLGISPGVVSGRVRVLLSPAQGAELAPGEILVTRSTDPEWTSLFARAGGMILELGSMLSHGAVVAREYRVPAVANIRGATQILTTGMEVTLDGRSGAVWVAVRAPTEATRPRGEVPSPE